LAWLERDLHSRGRAAQGKITEPASIITGLGVVGVIVTVVVQ
jgi:hypothetical protein